MSKKYLNMQNRSAYLQTKLFTTFHKMNIRNTYDYKKVYYYYTEIQIIYVFIKFLYYFFASLSHNNVINKQIF